MERRRELQLELNDVDGVALLQARMLTVRRETEEQRGLSLTSYHSSSSRWMKPIS